MVNKKIKKKEKYTKKKIPDMSVDEFMAHGLDSDYSSEEGDELEKELNTDVIHSKRAEKADKKMEKKSHKKQLENLKDSDPEFYKFLQENDEELLEFSGSEDESNENVHEDQSVEKDDINGNSTASSEIEEDEGGDESGMESLSEIDDDIEIDNDYKEYEKDEGRQVTPVMIKSWKKDLENDSLKTLKEVMSAFHAAVESMTPDAEEEKEKPKMKFIAKDGTTFNNLAAMCLKHSIRILEKHVAYQKEKKSKSPVLPSTSKDWGKIKGSMKQYLYDLLQLLRQLADPSMLTIILRHCQSLIPYYASFPKIAKVFLKRTIRMWSSGEEHVKVLAFLCIRKCVCLQPNLYEFALKKLYLGYVQNSKFMSIQRKPVIVFMQNSLVELFAINEVVAYQHAFVYIRQLAIHLRNAITVKKKDSHQSVYNWQFLCSLQLWAQVVGELHGDTLKPLVYPVVQITLGVSRLVPSARFYPIRFHCIEILNYLSKKTGVYIPTASYVLEVFESNEFLKKAKSAEKVPDIQVVLKVSKSQATAKGYQDAVIDVAFESLLEHYVTFSNSIAFPELVFPVCHRLKRIIKNSQMPKLSKEMKTLIEKLQKYSDDVTKARALVTFSPRDLDKVNEWEKKQNEKKSSLNQFYDTWKRMKELSSNANQHEEKKSDKDEGSSKKSKQIQTKKNSSGRKRKVYQEADKESDDGSTRKKKKVKATSNVLSKKTKKSKEEIANTDEDVLEDFHFSDDED